MPSDREKSILINQIREAFGESEASAAGPFFGEGIIEDGDRQHVEKLFSKRPWQSLTQEDVDDLMQEIFALSPTTYRYFLPALMLGVMDRPDRTHSLIYSLRPVPEHRQFVEDRIRGLSSREREAIILFLGYLRAVHGDVLLPRGQPDILEAEAFLRNYPMDRAPL